MVPNFHSQTDGDRFGFHQPGYLVPPGTEPDLQALNNPFIAEKRAKERQLAAACIQHSNSAGSGVSTTVVSTTDRPPSDFEENIDPSLRGPAVSGKTARSNEDGSNEAESVGDGEDGEGNGYKGDRTDTSDGESDGDLSQPRQQASAS